MMSTRETLRRNAAHNGRECPHCGERDGIEWNGQTGARSGYACHGHNGCREQWDAAEYAPLETLGLTDTNDWEHEPR